MSDYISRQALKNALTDWQMQYAEKDKDTERFETLGQVLDLAEQMPTIEPKQSHDWNGWENGCGRTYDFEPKRGKWIYLDGLDAFECSVCGRQMVRNIFDYCPWCGARMDAERSEE